MRHECRATNARDLLSYCKTVKVPFIAQEIRDLLDEHGAISDATLEELCRIFECEVSGRRSAKIKRKAREANLPYENAHRHDLFVEGARTFNKEDFNLLFRRDWLDNNYNVILTGDRRTGKSYVASALCIDALECDKSVHYLEFDDFLTQLNIESLSASGVPTLLRLIDTADVIVIDNWCYYSVTALAANMIVNWLEKATGRVSLVLTSERPLNQWGKELASNRADKEVLQKLIGRANQVNLLGLSTSIFIAQEGSA